jgi:Bifunctional DNA primase/polymerase, N-terminal/DnaB-like helicase C terminal domain
MFEKIALTYRDKFSFSVIPVNKEKKPLIKWQEYQERKPEPEEIKSWAAKYKDANVGIVTGKISNLAVVDIDEAIGFDEIKKLIPATIHPPIAYTPSGGQHWYFRMPSKELRLNVRKVPGCDLRADGGYVVAPPSKNLNGSYSWDHVFKLGKIALPQLPDSYTDFVMSSNSRHDVVRCRQVSSNVVKLFSKGRRDNDLFHLAHHLVKGSMPPEEILAYLEYVGGTCNFPPDEIAIKVKSALERAEKKDRNLTQEIREWVLSSNDVFLSSDVVKCLHLSSREDMKHVSKVLSRLCTENIIEKHGGRNGQFRIIDDRLEEIDWMNADDEEFKLELPLGIGKYVKVMPKNIIVVAGSPNSGKTALLLDIVFKNKHYKEGIDYFSSEMSKAELKGRIKAFGYPMEDWKFNAYDRCSNFADVIRPDAINIIDFLEIHDDFWKVGGLMKAIYEKLDKGIAIIALQKKRGSDMGKGGEATKEKPRLYLTMEGGKLCIEKGKNWRIEGVNPNGLQIDFKLVNGSKFLEAGPWAYKDGRPLEAFSPYARHYSDDCDLPI